MIDRVDNIIPVRCVPILRCQPFMGDLPCESHGADCRCCRLKRMILICSHKCGCKSRKLATGSRDGGHHRMAIVDAVRFFCVHHDINSACDRDHSPCPLRKSSSRMPPPHQGYLRLHGLRYPHPRPLWSLFPTASVLISEIFPRITVNFTVLRVRLPSMSRSVDALTPTGSALPDVPAHWPAFPRSSWDSRWYGCSAYDIDTEACADRWISATSSLSSAMIGEAPQARTIFAQSLTVTWFVILWISGLLLPHLIKHLL